ncbi:response regulator [Alkalinema sp. FACHB-956]|uniref:hybrid sensor histidine kinase/response regulator n=1 Tax=Alkalinema sp. FACHB-956 TaxID=2692768 RepID=UPI0016845096|nr:response regulator [Alkalinema sp. FACHB-956]MBD2328162.1 response regulator [Alkalinema sp. FACHB-956]
MDKELEIKRQFLDEAQAYLDALDAAILGIADGQVDQAKLNAALRSAHSIKGGAGMMGFDVLSSLAHRLEDGFKVLKIQRANLEIDDSLENQFLHAIDCLRQVIDHSRSQMPHLTQIDLHWLEAQVLPQFDALHDRLGDPDSEDAESVLNPEDGQEIITLLFETEVEGCLQRLEAVLSNPEQPCLREEVNILAQELGGLGEMLQLSEFSQLCTHVGQWAIVATPEQVPLIAQTALETWRHSQSLVLSGQRHHLPTTLTAEGLPELPIDLAADTAWADAGQGQDLPVEVASAVTGFEPGFDATADLDWSWDAAIAAAQAEPASEDFYHQEAITAQDQPTRNGSQRTTTIEVGRTVDPNPTWQVQPDRSSQPGSKISAAADNEVDEDATVRVPVRQLNQLNDLFGELAIERNGLELYLKRLRTLSKLLRERIKQLDQANSDVRSIYDLNSVARQSPAQGSAAQGSSQGSASQSASQGSSSQSASYPRLGSFIPANFPLSASLPSNPAPAAEDSTQIAATFDSLEMDRYGDLHSLSQQLMETIVQLQEVATDLDLGLDDAEQTTRDLNKTAKNLQSRLSQLRMRPLSDVTDRFPRALRELALQYKKKVRFNVVGGTLLIDRNILEALQDPLMHLLRNAFDHGIEDPNMRVSQGKTAEGLIEITAITRGNRTLITVRDDGGGIPLHKIRRRAEAMGLDAGLLATASEEDLLSLIFEPGFSTSDSVTAISGRGVGMDVVREHLKQIRGEITVNTQAGEGTTFTLSVPHTLSIARILLIESQGMLLAIPNDAVEEICLFQPDQLQNGNGRELLRHNGDLIPIVRLGQWLPFNCARQPQTLEAAPTINADAVLITRRGSERVGIHIQRCWGEQEVASRRIEGPLKLPAGFSNCTILGDGRIVPMVNMNELLQWITTYERVPNFPILSVSRIGLAPTTSQRPTLLIVDDSINVRRFLALTLERAGYRVEQAKDGQDAWDKLRAGLLVSAVICDVEMPRLDGFGLLTRLKADEGLRSLPVAMLTSRSGDKHRRMATGLGADAYFTKPYNEQDLLKTLKILVQASAEAAAV